MDVLYNRICCSSHLKVIHNGLERRNEEIDEELLRSQDASESLTRSCWMAREGFFITEKLQAANCGQKVAAANPARIPELE
jgi:hypothetical protein